MPGIFADLLPVIAGWAAHSCIRGYVTYDILAGEIQSEANFQETLETGAVE